MPPTATYEDIKTYQHQVEKNKITPHGLPPCPRCNLESLFFKLHAYRERRFLVIVDMLVKAVFCTLVRFRCTDCGKTITSYPDFVIPHKHYTRQTIEGFSRVYVENDQKTYQDAVMTDDGVPERAVSGRMLAPSSIHRWKRSMQIAKNGKSIADECPKIIKEWHPKKMENVRLIMYQFLAV